jgi:hypothetical protein
MLVCKVPPSNICCLSCLCMSLSLQLDFLLVCFLAAFIVMQVVNLCYLNQLGPVSLSLKSSLFFLLELSFGNCFSRCMVEFSLSCCVWRKLCSSTPVDLLKHCRDSLYL